MERPGIDRGLRIVLFGDGAWAADSLTRVANGPHDVVGVVVRRRPTDGSLEGAARCLGIPVLRPCTSTPAEMAAELQALAPDLGLSIAYDRILRRETLDLMPLGCLNFHAGKLPAYRGRNVVNWAIINGEREIGLTAHLVDEGIDTGDIVIQQTLPIGWTDGYGDVLRRLVQAMPSLVETAIDLVATGEAKPQPQDGGGTYYPGRQEGDEWLDWSDSSFNLHNKIRGITRPGPGARTMLEDQPVVIWRAFYDPAWPSYRATPGAVVGRSEAGVLVKTGDATLLVREVQAAGGICETPRWRLGTRLGTDLSALLSSALKRIEALEGRRP